MSSLAFAHTASLPRRRCGSVRCLAAQLVDGVEHHHGQCAGHHTGQATGKTVDQAARGTQTLGPVLDRMAQRGKEPVFKAVALRGVGVLETLLGLLEHTFAHLERLHALETKFGLKQSTFMAEVRQRLESGRT